MHVVINMGKTIKRIFMNKLLLLSVLALGVFSLNTVNIQADNNDGELQGHVIGTSQYFDSFVQINIYHRMDQDEMDAIEDEVRDMLRHFHQIATKHDSFSGVTNVKTINENPGEWHEVDADLFDMIQLSIEYYDITNGYFDITLGPVIELWDEYREDCHDFYNSIAGDENRQQRLDEELDDYCRVPSMEDLEAANEHVGIEGIELDHDNKAIRIEEGMVLDLGGIGKGYAAKAVGDYLKTIDGIDSFLLNAGTSNVEVHGDHPFRENKLWYTGLTDPTNPTQRYGSLKISSGDNVTTSGDYQRYYEVDGRKYHHLIDPNTLFPTDHHRSVSLVSSDGSIGDILVTAIFIMPLEEGLDFVNSHDGLEAIWYIDSNTVEMSDNLEEQYLRQLDLDGLSGNDEASNTALVLALLIPGFGLIVFSGVTLLVKKGLITIPFLKQK